MQRFAVALAWVHQEGRVGEFRRLGHPLEDTVVQVGLHHAGAEVATAALVEDELQGERAEVEAQCRARAVGQGGVVLAAECLSPVDVDVRIWLVDPAHPDELLLHQLLNLQAWAVGRLIDQRSVQQAHFDLAQQRFAIAHLAADGMAGQLPVQRTDPVEHHRVTQAHFAANMQHLLATFGQRQVAACRFPGLHQLVGITDEGLAIAGQAGAVAAAHEQLTAQLLFQALHPCCDRSL
ncbi:hypothetical protein D3C81_1065970 [compost metagenome]